MLKVLLMVGTALLCLSCERGAHEKKAPDPLILEGKGKMLKEVVGRLEALANRGQDVDALCASLRGQLAPLRKAQDALSRATLARFHRVCTEPRDPRR